VDLDRGPPRQRRNPDSGARMDAALAEQVADEIGCAVNDLRHAVVVGRAVDEAAEAHAADDAVERPVAGFAQRSEEIERADAGRLDAGRKVVVDTDLAVIREGAVPFADLAGQENSVAVATEGHE